MCQKRKPASRGGRYRCLILQIFLDQSPVEFNNTAKCWDELLVVEDGDDGLLGKISVTTGDDRIEPSLRFDITVCHRFVKNGNAYRRMQEPIESKHERKTLILTAREISSRRPLSAELRIESIRQLVDDIPRPRIRERSL